MPCHKKRLSALHCNAFILFLQLFENRNEFFVLFLSAFQSKMSSPNAEKVHIHKHARLHIHENGDFLCDASYSLERANFSTRALDDGTRKSEPACVCIFSRSLTQKRSALWPINIYANVFWCNSHKHTRASLSKTAFGLENSAPAANVLRVREREKEGLGLR